MEREVNGCCLEDWRRLGGKEGEVRRKERQIEAKD